VTDGGEFWDREHSIVGGGAHWEVGKYLLTRSVYGHSHSGLSRGMKPEGDSKEGGGSLRL